MTDWIVWPIFILELIAFLFLFLRKDTLLFSFHVRTIILSLLVIVCIAIAVSLYHDATTVLNLHF